MWPVSTPRCHCCSRGRFRGAVRRLLLRYGYPPDQQEEATILVLRQAEVLAGEAA